MCTASAWWLPRVAWVALASVGMFGAAALCLYRGQAAVGGVLVVASAGALAGMLAWWLLGRRPDGSPQASARRPAAPDAWLVIGGAVGGGASAECRGCAEQLAYVPHGAGVAGDNLLTLWSRHRSRCPRRGLEPVRAIGG